MSEFFGKLTHESLARRTSRYNLATFLFSRRSEVVNSLTCADELNGPPMVFSFWRLAVRLWSTALFWVSFAGNLSLFSTPPCFSQASSLEGSNFLFSILDKCYCWRPNPQSGKDIFGFVIDGCDGTLSVDRDWHLLELCLVHSWKKRQCFLSFAKKKQGQLHGYPSCMRVGRGRNWGHQIIWAGAVKPKISKTKKK